MVSVDQGSTMRRMLLLFAFIAAVILTLTPTALAQKGENEAIEDIFDCSDFATQTGAQAMLEPGDPSELDANNNGKPCEILKDGKAEDGTKLGANTGGDLDCIDFPTQKAAQAHLKDNPSDPNKLDMDKDGVACQIVPVPYENPASDKAPVEEAESNADLNCEDFEYQQEAQMVYLRDDSDPNNLDKNDNGLACEEILPVLASNQTELQVSQDSASAVASGQLLSGMEAEDGGSALGMPLLVALLIGPGALILAAWWHFRSRAG